MNEIIFNSSQILWEQLFQLNLFKMFFDTFSLVLGNWFYILLFFFLNIILFLRSQSFIIPSIVSVAFVGLLFPFLPREVFIIVGLIITINFTIALIKFFTRDEE
ncbi:MAG: hypothetical protein ABIL37_01310 [candidate division WOR-3 bacterium]